MLNNESLIKNKKDFREAFELIWGTKYKYESDETKESYLFKSNIWNMEVFATYHIDSKKCYLSFEKSDKLAGGKTVSISYLKGPKSFTVGSLMECWQEAKDILIYSFYSDADSEEVPSEDFQESLDADTIRDIIQYEMSDEQRHQLYRENHDGDDFDDFDDFWDWTDMLDDDELEELELGGEF